MTRRFRVSVYFDCLIDTADRDIGRAIAEDVGYEVAAFINNDYEPHDIDCFAKPYNAYVGGAAVIDGLLLDKEI